MAYTREVEGGGVLSCPIVVQYATVWAMQAGSRNERTVDSCTNDSR